LRYNDGGIKRDKQSQMPDFYVNHNPEKYMGILIEERQKMSNEELLEMRKGYFDEGVKLVHKKGETIHNGDGYTNKWVSIANGLI